MNFKVAPDLYEKLYLLKDATQFEPAGSEPMRESPASGAPIQAVPAAKSAAGERAPKPLPCISEVVTPAGKKPVLKAMMTTACERNCYYCPFRAGRSRTQRISFTPDEMALSFNKMQQLGYVDGLFLSSGIIKGSVTAQDKIIDTAEILRKKYSYRGYVHLKIMPGAEKDQIRRAMQLANRVSVNLEGPTKERLEKLAPQKDYWQELIQRLKWISQLRQQERLQSSVVTQFVVGAVGDTDLELLSVSEKLYTQLGLRRTYYSSFHPVLQTPLEELASSPPQREFRLYQSSFLLRDYGWNVEELPFGQDANLRLDVDPKQAWAEENLRHAPIEVNRAARHELLRVPGIGPLGADAIVAARRRQPLTDLSHLTKLGIRASHKSAPYITLNGKQPYQQLTLF